MKIFISEIDSKNVHEAGLNLIDISYRTLFPGKSAPRIGIGEKGKPFFVESDIQFNLSHSGEYAAAAFSRYPVGIDVQLVKKSEERVAKHFFTASEKEYLDSLDEVKKPFEFTKIWCAKEAYSKLFGIPLFETISKTETVSKQRLRSKIESVYIRFIDFDERYVLAVASEHRIMPELIRV